MALTICLKFLIMNLIEGKCLICLLFLSTAPLCDSNPVLVFLLELKGVQKAPSFCFHGYNNPKVTRNTDMHIKM